MWNSCFLSKLKKDQKFKWFFTRSWDQMWIVQWTSLLSSIVKSWVFQCSCHVSSVQDWSQVMAAQVTSTLLLWHQIAYQEGYCFETPHWHCSSSFCEQLCNEYAREQSCGIQRRIFGSLQHSTLLASKKVAWRTIKNFPNRIYLDGWTTKNVSFLFLALWHFPTIFVLSGNTFWPQASGFQKLAKMDHFVHSKWVILKDTDHTDQHRPTQTNTDHTKTHRPKNSPQHRPH